jgi:5-methylcytosine-specific restriction endonuclease McrA
MNRAIPRQGQKRLASELYRSLRQETLCRDGWRCQSCGSRTDLQVHHIEARSHLGDDSEQNLITLCANCHRLVHRER